MSEPTDRTPGAAWWVLDGLTFVLTSEAVRVAFPLLYDVREDAGASRAIVWALGAFALMPALSPLIRRVAGARPALLIAVVVLAAARLGMQLTSRRRAVSAVGSTSSACVMTDRPRSSPHACGSRARR